ncbi:MAG: polysaccharide biosynthesis/export family protein [Planctomycetota bacterium]
MPAHRSARPSPARPVALALVAGAAMAGCEVDSYFDPSITGRWERTPTTVPILERLAAIEGPEEQFVEYTDIQPEDLVPEIEAYRSAPGDGLRITAYDLIVTGRPDLLDRTIDSRGMVSLPQLGEVFVSGMTAEEIEGAIRRAMSAFVGNPLVTVEVVSPRQRTFTVFGSVSAPGPYFVPTSDYRLLEALNTAGTFNDAVESIFVIRQIPLSPEFSGLPSAASSGAGSRMPTTSAPTTPSPSTPDGAPPADDLIDLIDELTAPGSAPQRSMLAGRRSAQPANRQRNGPDPVIDLIEPNPGATTGRQFIDLPNTPSASGGARWVFAEGRWTQIVEPAAPAQSTPTMDAAARRRQLATQRVIRVPVKPLIAGDASVNIVVRPGDIIRVPRPDTGNIYLAGQVTRTGVYGLPGQGRLTLMRAIDAAGGLTPTAIPERVDLTRMVGSDRQATIRLNLRAIAEGSQPDIFMKADDRVNVGTNFWALPLAVMRNGFRFSYGFGFLLDRNFGNDVFGPPPSNVGG